MALPALALRRARVRLVACKASVRPERSRAMRVQGLAAWVPCIVRLRRGRSPAGEVPGVMLHGSAGSVVLATVSGLGRGTVRPVLCLTSICRGLKSVSSKCNKP